MKAGFTPRPTGAALRPGATAICPRLKLDREGTYFCLGCGSNQPSSGGYWFQGFFFCALHERKKGTR